MATRAKLLCKSKTFNCTDDIPATNGRPSQQIKMFNVRLEAVMAPSGPNVDDDNEDSIFGAYTPSADVNMNLRESAADHFEPGTYYYADFSAVE